MAPPTKDNPRYKMVSLRMSEVEKLDVEEACKERGMRLSEYLRWRIFGHAD